MKDTTNTTQPTKTVKAKKVFDIDLDWDVPSFDSKSEFVPEADPNYHFDLDTTRAILAGFKYNKRVLIQGLHGTGKSTHIEQVSARLNWPCIRINLDSHISRTDLIGKDVITLKDGQQVTEFQEGLLPWSLQNNVALVFDEYDAGRPDVMFVIQRILENEGRLTLVDQNKVITPSPFFRLFATANTIGLGDTTGLYHGTQQINQGQMDRWNIVTTLNYLEPDTEAAIIASKFPKMAKKDSDKQIIRQMIQLATLTRKGFEQGDLSTLMSPRTVLSWVDNYSIFDDLAYSFRLSFLNKCDELERSIVAEYYQRCFGEELSGYEGESNSATPSLTMSHG
tara:strand:- start:120 stop:1130 length:1011 start_codon:yes stop_codon:yes gene_type:complete